MQYELKTRKVDESDLSPDRGENPINDTTDKLNQMLIQRNDYAKAQEPELKYQPLRFEGAIISN